MSIDIDKSKRNPLPEERLPGSFKITRVMFEERTFVKQDSNDPLSISFVWEYMDNAGKVVANSSIGFHVLRDCIADMCEYAGTEFFRAQHEEELF